LYSALGHFSINFGHDVVVGEASCPRGPNMDDLLLTESPLDVNAAFRFVTEPATGATSIFVGTTRCNREL
jgi:hypothetical protein